MVGSKPAAAAPLALSLLACHALGLLSDMTAQAFTLASSSSSRNRHHHKAELKKHTRYRSRTAAALRAAHQEGYPDGDAWWEGDIDPWTEAESRVSVWGGEHTRQHPRVRGRSCTAVKKHAPQRIVMFPTAPDWAVMPTAVSRVHVHEDGTIIHAVLYSGVTITWGPGTKARMNHYITTAAAGCQHILTYRRISTHTYTNFRRVCVIPIQISTATAVQYPHGSASWGRVAYAIALQL